jgi:subtilase family serine protease
MHGTGALLVAALAATARAGTAMMQMDQVSSHTLASQGWTTTGELPAQQELTLEIGLTLQNTDRMIEKLLDVSNPKSPNYGKWLDRDAANALVQPEQEANDAVMSWLAQEGVTKLASDGTWVTFRTNLTTANRILAADFRQYRRNGVTKIRTTSYSVPQDVAKHVDLIHPTTFFGKTEAYRPVLGNRRVRRQAPQPQPATPSHVVEVSPDLALEPAVPTVATIAIPTALQQPKATGTAYFRVSPECNNGVTPVCLKQMYNIGNYTPSTSSGSRIGFGSFLNQSSQFDDVALWEDQFLIPRQNVTKIFVNNATNCQTPECAESLAGEANMDAQNMIAIAHPLPVYEYLTGGKPPFIPDLEMPTPDQNSNEPYVPFYQHLLRLSNDQIPQVISNSYGEPEQTVPLNYARRTCSMVALLGLRGVTIMESSGDTGIGSYCRTNDAAKKPRFLAEFPSSCPWITSIGGTEAVSPEIAWSDSSGGFSDYFAQPAYQAAAVSTVCATCSPGCPLTEAVLDAVHLASDACVLRPALQSQGPRVPRHIRAQLKPLLRGTYPGRCPACSDCRRWSRGGIWSRRAAHRRLRRSLVQSSACSTMRGSRPGCRRWDLSTRGSTSPAASLWSTLSRERREGAMASITKRASRLSAQPRYRTHRGMQRLAGTRPPASVCLISRKCSRQ